jgi:hypothetical protein
MSAHYSQQMDSDGKLFPFSYAHYVHVAQILRLTLSLQFVRCGVTT